MDLCADPTFINVSSNVSFLFSFAVSQKHQQGKKPYRGHKLSLAEAQQIVKLDLLEKGCNESPQAFLHALGRVVSVQLLRTKGGFIKSDELRPSTTKTETPSASTSASVEPKKKKLKADKVASFETLKPGKPKVLVIKKYSEETLRSVLDDQDREWLAERQAVEEALNREAALVHRTRVQVRKEIEEKIEVR